MLEISTVSTLPPEGCKVLAPPPQYHPAEQLLVGRSLLYPSQYMPGVQETHEDMFFWAVFGLKVPGGQRYCVGVVVFAKQ